MRTVGLLGNTKDRSLIFVISEAEMVGRLKEDRVVFMWKKMGVILVVGCYLSARGKNLNLEMRLIHGRSSSVIHFKFKKNLNSQMELLSSFEKAQVFGL